MPATTSDCDAGSGDGVAVKGTTCGGVKFIVPNNWVEAANYTIVVQSLSTSTDVGYTDAVTIAAANSTTASSTVASLSILDGAASTAAAVVSGSSTVASGSATSSGKSASTASTKTGTSSTSGSASKSASASAAASSAASGAERIVGGGCALVAAVLVGLTALF
ncbi:hypothetical protein P7C70_g5668, partial [Phenoliferia sp. Uapishka_3]